MKKYYLIINVTTHFFFRFLNLCTKSNDIENTKEIIDFLYDNNNNDIDINIADASGNFPLLIATVCEVYFI